MASRAFEISFDKKSRTAYLRFSHEKIAETTEFADGSLVIDLDHRGQLVGIEILTAGTLKLLLQPTAQMPFEAPPINQADVDEIEQMLAGL